MNRIQQNLRCRSKIYKRNLSDSCQINHLKYFIYLIDVEICGTFSKENELLF